MHLQREVLWKPLCDQSSAFYSIYVCFLKMYLITSFKVASRCNGLNSLVSDQEWTQIPRGMSQKIIRHKSLPHEMYGSPRLTKGVAGKLHFFS